MSFYSRDIGMFSGQNKVRKIRAGRSNRNGAWTQGRDDLVVNFPERNIEISCPESSERIFQNIKILTFQTNFEDSNGIEKYIDRKMVAYRRELMLWFLLVNFEILSEDKKSEKR